MMLDSSQNSVNANESAKTMVDQRLDKYDEYRRLIHHPVEGMAAKGFTAEQIKAAEMYIDEMQDFYEDLYEAL